MHGSPADGLLRMTSVTLKMAPFIPGRLMKLTHSHSHNVGGVKTRVASGHLRAADATGSITIPCP